MDNFFKFSHTIQEQSNSSEDNFDNLFRIGGKDIEKEQRQERIQKKEKDIQKDIKDKKKKKHKKDKKHNIQKQYMKQSDEEQYNKYQQSVCLMKKYQLKVSDKKYQIQPIKTIDDILQQQFALNQKIMKNGLTFNILKFGDQNLKKYGVKDEDVPVFSRDRSFPYVIGMKKNRKSKKIGKQLNKIINQKPLQVQKQYNLDRYYHYEGYDQVQSVRINQLKHKNNQQIITFQQYNSKKQYIEKPQQKLKLISKQYNKQLNENPTNVQIWLKFINLQDKIGQYSNKKNNSNVAFERKISIVEKAIKYNQDNQQLALIYLKMLHQIKKERAQIQKKTLQFININPQSSQLWIFYLQFRVSNFLQFCHTRLQKNYQQIDRHLQNNIQKAKSSVQIWKIRKASLAILNKVLKVFVLQGYTQLVTSICTSLLQYNIFVPQQLSQSDQQRFKSFKMYWQQYQKYRVGQIQNSSWINSTQNINQYCQEQYIQNWVDRFCQIKTNQAIQWIPSHTKHHQKRIQQQPQSFIFFDDIQPFVKVYRSKQNLQMLMDVFMNNLQMPTIYQTIDSHSFLYKWIQNSLISQRNTKINVQFPLWNKFWPLKYTQQFLPSQNICKFIYSLRVCRMLRHKNINNAIIDKQLNQYLLFLYGVIYTYQPLQLYLSSQKCIKQIQNILTSDPTNIKLWALYIQIQSLNGKSSVQCVDCFYQCLMITQEQIDKLWVLYWLKSYLVRNQLSTQIIQILLVQILLKNSQKQLIIQTKSIIFSQHKQQLQIQQMDKILLSNKLKQFWSVVHKNNQNKTIIYYFLLDIGFRSDQMVQQILKMQTQLGIYMLIDHNLITLQHIAQFKLVKRYYSSFTFLRYWLYLLPSVKLFSLFINFQKQMLCCQNKLLLWFILMRLLRNQYKHVKSYFSEYFLSKGKQICNKDINNQPQCVIILNKLLKDANFVFFCLDKLPYCRCLYQLLGQLNPEKQQKIQSLALEKQIRRRKRI